MNIQKNTTRTTLKTRAEVKPRLVHIQNVTKEYGYYLINSQEFKEAFPTESITTEIESWDTSVLFELLELTECIKTWLGRECDTYSHFLCYIDTYCPYVNNFNSIAVKLFKGLLKLQLTTENYRFGTATFGLIFGHNFYPIELRRTWLYRVQVLVLKELKTRTINTTLYNIFEEVEFKVGYRKSKVAIPETQA
jgi:hypothetical protein